MYHLYLGLLTIFACLRHISTAYLTTRNFECGPYGFICEANSKLRLCEGDNLLGPAFTCPPNTVCNEDSNDVCENTINYIDPSLTRTFRCSRNERIADPSVPGCKGYILCIPNKNRFQGIKFKCSGNTIFNGFSRTCSSPGKYKCPLSNVTKSQPPTPHFYADFKRRVDTNSDSLDVSNPNQAVHKYRPIDCKNYKFTVTEDTSPVRATYFCPPAPIRGESTIRCTIFSNKFCITLEKDNEDQFIQGTGPAFRRPRLNG